MDLFENIENIFNKIRSQSECAKTLVTLATAIGTLIVLYHTFKILFNCIQGFRLYVVHQLCCQVNFKQKYGKWAVVSGATDGIGLSFARDLARRGMSVVVLGRSEEKLSKTKESLEREPNAGEIVTVKADLSDSSKDNYNKMVQMIDPENRDIGLLINNAGMAYDITQPFCNFEPDQHRYIVDLNIVSTLLLTRMIMPGMLKRGKGLIINVTSALSFVYPTVYTGLYGATKRFLRDFTRQLQIEYKSYPIDIIDLAAGGVRTKLLTNMTSVPESILIPGPDEFARSSLNAASTRIRWFSGTLKHALVLQNMILFRALGLLRYFYVLNMRLYGKRVNFKHDYEIGSANRSQNEPSFHESTS